MVVKLKYIIFIVVAFLSCSSCKYIGVTKVLATYRGSYISMPKSVFSVVSGMISHNGIPASDKMRLIVFVPDEDCTKCMISNIDKYGPMYDLLDVIILFSPRAEHLEDVMRELAIRNFEHPLYIDMDNTFQTLNSFIVDDSRFHCVLVDNNMKIKFVGDPTANVRTLNLMKKHLN